MVKRTKKSDRKISNKKPKTDNKTTLQQSSTLERFFTISKISNKEKVKKIWDDLNDEKRFLLEDEYTQMHEDWLYLLKDELVSEYYLNIKRQIASIESRGIDVLPQRNLRFRCFKTSPFDISVVIVGQDPYPNDADGLAFSSETIKPSLKKIFNLLEWDIEDMKWSRPRIGSLEKWSKNVLLLNSILTVERGKSGSHSKLGWQKFTDKIIKLVGDKREVVTILWGKYAKEKASLVRNGHVIKSGHPSPLNRDRSFDNSRYFSLANEYLKKVNRKVIDWSL